VNNKDEFSSFSKKRLINNLTKKFNTTTIGSLAAFEDSFGFLWGHGKPYSDLDDDEKYYRDLWSEARTKILDLGNSNSRAAQNEVGQYTLTWNRYITNFYVVGDQDNE
tara:strand:+ start:1242 stop:1565 length:324 start_codon:yes stop_codon:yes gene_type:complete